MLQRRSTALLTTLLAGSLVAAIGPAAPRPAGAQGQADGPAYVPGQVLVQFHAAASAAQRQNALDRAASRGREAILTHATRGAGSADLVLADTAAPVGEAVRRLQNDPAVEFAEPNWIYTHAEVSNDPAYTDGSLWGMFSNDSPTVAGPAGTTNTFGSRAEQAWAAGHIGSRAVYVGVIDEGVDFNHPDLAANIWTNPGESGTDINGLPRETNGVDDDGNGFVDDVHGWDHANNDNSIYDGQPGDNATDAHGTHVSGTIGGLGGNGQGVAGVNWNVTIISSKFLLPNGGTLTDAIKAVNYLTALKQRGVNLVAINNSWGGGGYSTALHQAILKAAKANILFICAAGNNGRNTDQWANYPSNYSTLQGAGTELPASYEAVLSVAAIDRSGNRASFSNYGRSTVDLGAPGVGIWSTTPNGTYSSYSGTSMATPHVTGAAALYASTHPTDTPAQIRGAILGSTLATNSMNKKTVTGGRLNVAGF